MESGGSSEHRDVEPPEEGLRSVEPGYKNVIRGRLLILWLVILGAAVTADMGLLEGTAAAGLLKYSVLFLALVVIATAPERIYRRLKYQLSERLLQVVRGWVFHTDTVVPLIRVQHLDVVRGPFEKLFGTATLVVHTAGTHNSTVSLPGLSPERAAEIRDAIREKVRTDFE